MTLANGQKADVTGEGRVFVPSLKLEISNVLLTPTIDYNILSVSALDKQGFCVMFEKGECIIKKNNKVVARAKQEGNLYILKGQTH